MGILKSKPAIRLYNILLQLAQMFAALRKVVVTWIYFRDSERKKLYSTPDSQIADL